MVFILLLDGEGSRVVASGSRALALLVVVVVVVPLVVQTAVYLTGYSD